MSSMSFIVRADDAKLSSLEPKRMFYSTLGI